MFDISPFDNLAFDSWTEEIGELTIDFPLSINYVCVGKKYSGRIVCQKDDYYDKALVIVSDCKGNPLPLNQFDVSVKVYPYSSDNEILTIPSFKTDVTGQVHIPLTGGLDTGYYKMKIFLQYHGESVIAPSYGFIRLSVV